MCSKITCDICYENPLELTKTPCSHYFCNKCLTQWLMFNTSCPSCRHTIGIDTNKPDILREYLILTQSTIRPSKNVIRKINNLVHDLLSYILNIGPAYYTHKWKFNSQDYSTTIIKNNIMYIISVNIMELFHHTGQSSNSNISIDVTIDYKMLKKNNYKWDQQKNKVKHLKKLNKI